jgi:hypothetical protein
VIEPNDYLAFIGRNPGDENVYIATGDSGHGMTHGTIAGMVIPDLILGVENRWATLYDPSRVTTRAAGPFVKENVNVAAQYIDWVTPGEVSSPDEIKPGSGAVMRQVPKNSPSIATTTAASTSARPSAPISTASSTGTRSRRRGTAPVTDRGSTRSAGSSTDPPWPTWRNRAARRNDRDASAGALASRPGITSTRPGR